MAKQTLPTNYKDDVLATSMGKKRRYNLIQNDDGTISLEDVTEYTQVGNNYGAAQLNATNQAVNESVDQAKIIDSLDDISANTQSGMVAGALAVAELNGKSETKLSFVVGFDIVETNSIKRKSNLIEISIKALKNAVLQSTGSLGTVPNGFRPTHEVIVPAVGWTASGVPCSASISIGTDGVVGFRQSGSATRWIIFHASYFI